MEFIDLKEQYRRYQEEIDGRMRRVLQHGRFIMGPEVSELEERLADFAGVKQCITVASGTMSLEIALRALGIGPGDEVITVPFTWISTAEVVRLVGARPVFVDIEPKSYNIDAGQIENVVSDRTKAIIPVSLFGQMAELDRIQALCEPRAISVIEDGAQSFGAARNGRRSCGASKLGSTSFFPAKTFGCYGDGGALFTSDEPLARRIRAIRAHGATERHHHDAIGTNGRFDTLQAAVLLAKLPHLEEELGRRDEIAIRYTRALGELGIRTPATISGNTHVYGQYTIRVDERDGFRKGLREGGIPTAVYYPKCLHEQPAFEDLGYRWGDFPVAEKASREVVSLPMHPFLDSGDQDQIIELAGKFALRQEMISS